MCFPEVSLALGGEQTPSRGGCIGQRPWLEQLFQLGCSEPWVCGGCSHPIGLR